MSHRLMRSPSLRSRLFSYVLKKKFKPALSPDKLDLDRLRARLEAQARSQKIVKGVSVQPVDESGVKGEWQIPEGAPDDQCIFYCHGGGYAFCSPATHRAMTAALAKESGYKVFSLDYRLCPENPFPAPVEDALACYHWLQKQGITTDRIVLGGDSAGGGLCLALMLKLKQLNEPLPAGALLLSPWTDMTVSGDSVEANEPSCAMFYADSIRTGAQNYVPEDDRSNPLASPLFGDLAGLPPLWVVASDNEVLRDDSVRLAEKIQQQGGEVELMMWSRQPHVWPTFYPFLPEAKLSVQQMAEFVRTRIA